MRFAGGGARGNVSLKRKKELFFVFFFLMIMCLFLRNFEFIFSFFRKRFSLIFSTLVGYCVFLYISLSIYRMIKHTHTLSLSLSLSLSFCMHACMRTRVVVGVV